MTYDFIDACGAQWLAIRAQDREDAMLCPRCGEPLVWVMDGYDQPVAVCPLAAKAYAALKRSRLLDPIVKSTEPNAQSS